MVVDYIITSNADKAIEQFKNTKFNLASDREYQKVFLTLPRNIQRILIYNILKTQAEVLRENIKAYRSTTLMGFGTFKYREGKKRAEVMRDKLAQEHGYLTFAEVNDTEIREKIINAINNVKRNVFINEHIERVKTGKSYGNAKVYTSFRK